MTLLYSISLFSLIIGMGAIFTLIEKFPVKILYYHYHFRKPAIWSIFALTLAWQIIRNENNFPISSIIPLVIIALSVILTYKVHQSNWFKAVYFPKTTTNLETIPLTNESQLAVIEYEGITKAYPLDYVIHHHIVNDDFNGKTIALTYCAMCRSIIAFDVTEIGPLFVASFKNANMIVADKKTGTFFQQASFNSIIGKLHPHSLKMITYQILPWEVVKELNSTIQIAIIKKSDLRPFRLPMPGVWKKVMSSELTPGLSNKDKTFPSKTHVIGIVDLRINANIFYLKTDVLQNKITRHDKFGFTIISIGNTITGFRNTIKNHEINLVFTMNKTLEDTNSSASWDFTGKYIKGELKNDLEKIAISDEYWFSWKKFHPKSKLLRLKDTK